MKSICRLCRLRNNWKTLAKRERGRAERAEAAVVILANDLATERKRADRLEAASVAKKIPPKGRP